MKKRVCIAVIGLIAMVAAAGCGKEKTEEVARIAETEAYAPQEETEPQEEAAGSEADADKEDAAEDDGEKASDEEESDVDAKEVLKDKESEYFAAGYIEEDENGNIVSVNMPWHVDGEVEAGNLKSFTLASLKDGVAESWQATNYGGNDVAVMISTKDGSSSRFDTAELLVNLASVTAGAYESWKDEGKPSGGADGWSLVIEFEDGKSFSASGAEFPEHFEEFCNVVNAAMEKTYKNKKAN